jgi:subtilisin family serine protease
VATTQRRYCGTSEKVSVQNWSLQKLDEMNIFPLAQTASGSDPRSPEQWGLHRIGASAAWQRLEARHEAPQPVTVAVIGTGVNSEHADLQGQLWVNPGEIPGNGIDDDGNGFCGRCARL